MFPSLIFFILLTLSNLFVFLLVRLFLNFADILDFFNILNFFDISNLNIMFALLITNVITILIHSINALNKGELKIYPSDSILLKNMLENIESGLENKDKYFIWPEHFLSHENYGVVVYGVDKDYKNHKYDSPYRELQDEKKQFDGDYAELLNIINEWINDEALGKKAYKEKIEPFAQ